MIKLSNEIIEAFRKIQPSIELCVEKCGAKCCRAGFDAGITFEEISRLNSKLIGRKLNVEWDEMIKKWRWHIGRPCFFLHMSGPKKNMCSIHDERPDCCRRFPAPWHAELIKQIDAPCEL